MFQFRVTRVKLVSVDFETSSSGNHHSEQVGLRVCTEHERLSCRSKKSTFRFAFRNVVVGQDDVVAAAADGVPVREGLALRSRLPRLAGGHLHPDRHFSFPGRQHQR